MHLPLLGPISGLAGRWTLKKVFPARRPNQIRMPSAVPAPGAPAYLVAPRLLFYAVNGLGLGHVTRLLAIARAVRSRRPDSQILFVTTSEADSVIYREGFAAIKIPSRSIIKETRISPKAYLKLVHTVVSDTVASYNPAILIADTFPAGASQELLPSLSWEMKRAFVFRAQKEERIWDAFFQAALGHYHVCIAPHREGDEKISVPASVPVKWTGPIMIRTRDEALDRDVARQILGIDGDERAALVTFGGGGDTELETAIETAVAACRRTGWAPIVADAPLTRRDVIPRGVPRVSYYPLAELLNGFDCAITAAGYNSVAELMHFGVPSVIIPFERGLDDQPARAKAMADAGAALTCALDVHALSAELDSLASQACRDSLAGASRRLFPQSGALAAADAILGLL